MAFQRLALATLLIGAAPIGAMVAPLRAQSICYDGVQGSGSIYRICLPPVEQYNNKLVIWAHGFQDATEPVAIPEEQLQLGEVYLPELFNQLGFGFATNSYSKTGLAIVQGQADILDLVDIYTNQVGAPTKIFLTGASEGGIITTLLVEQHPEIFDGGLAACGPIGDFVEQINYFGDARATFEFYFPGLIPGDPFAPPQWLVESWSGADGYYVANVEPVLVDPANLGKLTEWAHVARLPFDENDFLATVMTSAEAVLRYSVVNSNDAATTLGGAPFGNKGVWYRGANNPWLLNLKVPRMQADPAALEEMRTKYTTTGALARPLMTMHTLKDEQVPYWHETIYTVKNLSAGSFLTQRVNLPVDRFGHCNFTEGEAVAMFFLLLIYDGNTEAFLADYGGVVDIDAAGNLHLLHAR